HYRVDGEGVLTEHHLNTGHGEGSTYQLERIIGAVAQGDTRQLEAEPLGQRLLEGETVAIGITGQLRHGPLHRLAYRGSQPEGVLVPGQLDDAGRVQTELPGQLFHRLAGHIGRQLLHARQRQTQKITTHVQASSSRRQAASTAFRRTLAACCDSFKVPLWDRNRESSAL